MIIRWRASIVLSIVLGLLAAGCASKSKSVPSEYFNEQESIDDEKIETSRPESASEASEYGRPAIDWPLDEARLTRGYKPKIGRKRPHWGIDLAGPKGTPILAAHNGLVVYVGKRFKGYGNMILIEDEHNNWATVYAHLSKFYVREGDRISQGQEIGAMGRTGRATGVHLHFELRKGKTPVDPILYLPDVKSQIAQQH